MNYRVLGWLLLLLLIPLRIAKAEPASPGAMQQWAEKTFSGGKPDASGPAAPGITVVRQDYGRLQRGESVMGDPMRIGSADFQHGLGTHANSEISVTLPTDAKTFDAKVGVDSDKNAGGSIVFVVQAAGKELFRSDVLLGGAQAVPVHVDIPAGTDVLTLLAQTTAAGPANDHADWADAKLTDASGKSTWIDDMPMNEPKAPTEFLPSDTPPFSFIYGGGTSQSLLPNWQRQATPAKQTADGMVSQITWTDPKTGLAVIATVTALTDFPAVEWVLHFKNTGAADTPILERVQALDQVLGTGPASASLVLDQINGSLAADTDFVPHQQSLKPGESVHLAPQGGRSSCGTFPFFNLRMDDGGLFVAIGWTGQWAATLERYDNGAAHLVAGMELTHLKLHPGEMIRTPRILLFRWTGDVVDAHNQFRRMMLAHYQPKVAGAPVQMAIGVQMFNSWAGGKRPEWGTEAGQIASAKVNAAVGADTLWMDAGWFPGGFPNGVGNWIPRPNDFPHGMKPVGDECRKLGIRFLVWFEPERVVNGTDLARNHPEFILAGSSQGLFNLGDEKARRYMTDLLEHDIEDWGLACYREDFNMEPLPYWRQNDPPDRQGITEIRHIEGLYAMWDELRAKFPNLYMDNCASGGRRIDLETCKRAVVQTRSDSEGRAGRADWEQSQTWGLNQYVPMNCSFGWDMGTYDLRSYASGGFLGEWDLLDPKFPVETVRSAFAEIRANQKYWLGDYYPLTPWTMAADQWMAYQFHRADLGEGMVLAFRHAQSPDATRKVSLRGLDPATTYHVEFVDEDRKSTYKDLTGKDLANLELDIPTQRASLLVRYAAVKGQ